MKPIRTALVALIAAAGLALGLVSLASATPLPGVITSITPASGPTTGGTTVTITGTQLWDALTPSVQIGGADAAEVSHITNPDFSETIVVTTPAGTAGPADVLVREGYPVSGGNPAYWIDTAERMGGFTYVAPAVITVTGVSPASGLTTGGEPITITGSGFAGSAAPTVTLGGTAATDVTVVSDTSLTATTPAHAAGAVDVSVARGSDTGTKAGAYTYNQGFWLTVNTTKPASTGGLESPGGIRTPAFGNWATVETTGKTGIFGTGMMTTTSTGYSGGINCGARTVKRQSLLIFTSNTTESWSAGACRYAFPSGAKVDVTALPSSSTLSLAGIISIKFEAGFLGAWRNDCGAVTSGTCTVQMTTDRTVGATWGFISTGILGILGNVVYPTYNASGDLQYYDTFALFPRAPAVVGGTPTYVLGVTIPAKAAAATQDAAAIRGGKVVCRTAAHLVGKRLSARCAVTPALARALRRGSVHATSTWYVRLPHSSALQPIGRGHLMLRGRRASAITG